jgi:hypothetical protein
VGEEGENEEREGGRKRGDRSPPRERIIPRRAGFLFSYTTLASLHVRHACIYIYITPTVTDPHHLFPPHSPSFPPSLPPSLSSLPPFQNL